MMCLYFSLMRICSCVEIATSTELRVYDEARLQYLVPVYKDVFENGRCSSQFRKIFQVNLVRYHRVGLKVDVFGNAQTHTYVLRIETQVVRIISRTRCIDFPTSMKFFQNGKQSRFPIHKHKTKSTLKRFVIDPKHTIITNTTTAVIHSRCRAVNLIKFQFLTKLVCPTL